VIGGSFGLGLIGCLVGEKWQEKMGFFIGSHHPKFSFISSSSFWVFFIAYKFADIDF
jgi:hypothetical protein